MEPQTVPAAPDDIDTRTCSCKDACDTRRCICRRWSGECKHNCNCRQDCNSPFGRVKELYFNIERPGLPALRPTSCFVDYAQKGTKLITPRGGTDHWMNYADTEGLETLLLADAAFFDTSGDLREWKQKLDILTADSEERKEHMQWLFRLAFSNDTEKKSFYSLCLNIWTDDNTHRHCAVCSRCCSLDVSWHCGVCRQCRHDGLDKTCFRCGGRSLTAESRLEKDMRLLGGMDEDYEDPLQNI